MKKIITITIFVLSAALVLAGCSSTKSKKTSIEDYKMMDGEGATAFSSYKKVNPVVDLSSLELVSEADPDTETERHTAETTAKVYSKNSTNASVIGEYETDDEVWVIEKLTGTNWYKVLYNGRVAYVQTAVLEVKEDFANSYNNFIGYVAEDDETSEHDETKAAEDSTTSEDRETEGNTGGADEPTEGGSEADEPTAAPAEPEPEPAEPAGDTGEED